MIKGIFTPCRAKKLEDVETRLNLLEKTIGKDFPWGLEIVGSLSDFFNPVISHSYENIINNIKKAKEHGLKFVSIHAPIERERYQTTDFTKKENIDNLQTVFNLAKEIKAEVVVIHCEGYPPPSWKELTDQDREQKKSLISQNLKRLKRGPIPLGIENVTEAIDGDVFFCSNNMAAYPLFADPLELYDFVKENGFQITFDTSHWATLCIPISLVDIYKKIEDQVCHIHLSDAYGRWIDGVSRCREGVIPGEGNLGKENFRQLLAYLKESKKPITLNVEVNDKDFKRPKESEESLKRVSAWLRQ